MERDENVEFLNKDWNISNRKPQMRYAYAAMLSGMILLSRGIGLIFNFIGFYGRTKPTRCSIDVEPICQNICLICFTTIKRTPTPTSIVTFFQGESYQVAAHYRTYNTPISSFLLTYRSLLCKDTMHVWLIDFEHTAAAVMCL